MKLYLVMAKAWLVNKLRNFLGINNDVAAVSEDITKLVAMHDSVAKDMFNMFHALPFVNMAVNLNAAQASKFTNPGVATPNSLLILLLHIIFEMRQGSSYLQVPGTIDEKVQAELKSRGFRIDNHVASAEAGGANETFIVWA